MIVFENQGCINKSYICFLTYYDTDQASRTLLGYSRKSERVKSIHEGVWLETKGRYLWLLVRLC